MKEDKISDAVAQFVQRRMDDMLADAMLLGSGNLYTSNLAVPSEPLTLASIERTIKALGPPPPPRSGQIIESVHMVDRHEDWSKARSPSRTRRRMRYNAARIYTSYTPKKSAFRMPDGSLVMHPAMAALFCAIQPLTDERRP